MSGEAAAYEMGTVEMALDHAARLARVRPEVAVAQAREVLRALPGHPQARLIEGQALHAAGALDEAYDTLSSLAAEQPRSAATALELGLVASDRGETALALASFRRAVGLKPDLAPAWTALATALRGEGDDAEADRADLAAIRASTRDPLLLQAAHALGERRFEEAEPLLRRRLKSQPDDVAATRMLGELAWRIGRLDDAVALLRRSLDLAPAFNAARELLARILGGMNQLRAALDEAELLASREPSNASYAMLKASLLVRVGEHDEARRIYEGVIARYPRQPRTWMNLGHVLKTLGKRPEAVDAYRQAIDINPGLGEAWWSLANLKSALFDDADVAEMRAGLKTDISDEDRFHLHFALGKALEDAGRYDESFAEYDAGNRLRRKELAYDADETHAECEDHARIFSAPFLASRAEGGCPAEDPIFIVGLPRSGSTLVEQILSSHSQVEGTMELPDLMMMASRLQSREVDGAAVPYAEVVRALSPADRTRLGEEYLERTRIYRRTGRPRFIDKMPNNWQHVGLVRLILPNARIVDARRHPLGCCLSGWKQHFARGQAFSYDLVDIGRYYSDYVAQMAAFEEAAPGHVHRVIYERMVADTRGEIERLLAYLGLPFEDGCLSFWENDRAVRTASSEQVRRPIFTDGVDHWRRYEDRLSPLIDTLGPVLASYPAAPSADARS